MNVATIEQSLQDLIESFDPQNPDNFIYELLLAYNLPKSSIARLKTGNLNISKDPDAILWKQKMLFKVVKDSDLHLTISQLKEEVSASKHAPRFIIVTNYDGFLAVDTKTKDTLDTTIQNLAKHFDFFLPWAGMEKSQISMENAADRKAAEKMARLYDLISQDNPMTTREEAHALNVFLSRLLFCFFAEDTDIFADNIFTNAISSHTQADGSDLHTYLDRLFLVLNTDYPKRDKALPAYLNAFPYVNGGLFKDSYPAPTFDHKSRQMLTELGSLDWAAINPDIFGSMMQGVILPSQRAHLGMHYTSVPNIMKVIEPLFLDDLRQKFENSSTDPRKLNKLLERLGKLKIFDPACGSGNFLIIAYKELCALEIEILQQLEELKLSSNNAKNAQRELVFSRIRLDQFYGIEIDDLAHELAILSLWLAQHQMNLKFKAIFTVSNPTLPLQAGGNIALGNACRIDWEKVCPKVVGDEIYILGNPPYVGFKMQSSEQKEDMDLIFKGIKDFKSLDFISCWFFKASQYISGNITAAFVTTNSICQGSQVPMLWPHLYLLNIEIAFAYSSFLWVNSAKNNAGVSVSIIGLRQPSNHPKYLFSDNIRKTASNINAYLIDYDNIIIEKRKTVLSNLPKISDGSGALDGGNLVLSDSEKTKLVNEYPESAKLIRKLVGSEELINDISRWCLWIENKDVEYANSVPPIKERINAVRLAREQGGTRGKNCINTPHKFAWINKPKQTQIVIPTVSSERRQYIPISYFDTNTIVANSASIVHDPEPYVFGLLTSNIHMVWIRSVCGKLETRLRYTSALCYNTFPFPNITDKQKKELDECAYRILDAREHHSEKTLAELYDPVKMPEDLRHAHKMNDIAIERCYRSKPFSSDEERLEYLFKLYEKMIAEESVSKLKA